MPSTFRSSESSSSLRTTQLNCPLRWDYDTEKGRLHAGLFYLTGCPSVLTLQHVPYALVDPIPVVEHDRERHFHRHA